MYKGVPASQNSRCSIAIAVRARPNTFCIAHQLFGNARTLFSLSMVLLGELFSRATSVSRLHGGITHSIYAFTFLFSILFRAFLHRVAGTTPQRHSRVGGRIVVGRRHRFRHIHAVHVAFALRPLVPKRQQPGIGHAHFQPWTHHLER